MQSSSQIITINKPTPSIRQNPELAGYCVFNGCINVSNVIEQHCLSDGDDQRVCTAQVPRESLFLSDNVGRYGCLTTLNRSEFSRIVDYLATG